MTTETNTTDFDTVRACLDTAPNNQRAWYAVNRIEASHAALVAALEAILADYYIEQSPTTDGIEQAIAAIALAKGGAK